jgi:5-methylcytosine-specific restriction endonuclease McrA
MTAVPKPAPALKEPKTLKQRVRAIPTTIKDAVFKRDGWTCQWCLVPGGSLDPHHRIRRSQGGPDKAWNLVSVHRVCHRYIHEHPTEAKQRGFLA